MTSPLAAPITLPNGTVLKNRFCKSAMTEAMAGKDDVPNDRHVTLYRRWAKGGMALQVTGNVMVDRRYLERPGNVVVEDEGDMAALSQWAEASKLNDTQVWVQINHPGRQCPMVVNARPLSPSTEKLRILGLFAKPRAMTVEDIHEAIARYAEAARIVHKAGFDGVQIHAAHGYLISQFLSPNINKRSDDWGGPLENRARLLRSVVQATREAVGPDCPVGVKLNSADFQKGGFSLEDCKQVAIWLQEDGIDLLEISGGTYEEMSFAAATPKQPQRDSTKAREAFFLEYAREIRQVVSLPLMVTGGFRSRAAMEDALTKDGTDMIGLARPLCVHPDAVSDLISGKVAKIGVDEDDLALGSGTWGITAQNWVIALVNTVARVEYYAWQMDRMAIGQEPDLSSRVGALRLVLGYLGKSTFGALRRKTVAGKRRSASGA